jgi:uncharacterized LabA/DUF88 family protein
MVFVDASNFLNGLATTQGLDIDEGFPSTAAIRMGQSLVEPAVLNCRPSSITPYEVVRRYWVGSIYGNEEKQGKYEDALRACGFEPVLIPKRRDAEEKGVDMALALRMLTNAFQGNYDAAVLVTGDADYVDLVGEVKRYGPRVHCLAFEGYGLSPRLKRAADGFYSCERLLANRSEFEGKLKDLATAHKERKSGGPRDGPSVGGLVRRLKKAKDDGVDVVEARAALVDLLAHEINEDVQITPRESK